MSISTSCSGFEVDLSKDCEAQLIGVAAPVRLKSTIRQIAFAGGLASLLDVEFAGMTSRTLKHWLDEVLPGLFWVGKETTARTCTKVQALDIFDPSILATMNS